MEIFGSLSGLMLNRNKTQRMWVGKLKNCKDKIKGIKWENKPIKALGIYFGHDIDKCDELNWEGKINQMKKILISWEKRNLTIIGKILIIKSLILPKFTFIASSCTVPERYTKEIESCCFKFIWKGKPDKIKRSVLINTYEKGGLNMVGIDSYFKSLKTSWVSRLTNNNLANWKVIPMRYFNKLGKHWLVFNMNIDDINNLPKINNLPAFYRDIIMC
jgi:hypothetical protein